EMGYPDVPPGQGGAERRDSPTAHASLGGAGSTGTPGKPGTPKSPLDPNFSIFASPESTEPIEERFSYDAAGNLYDATGRTYDWFHANQLMLRGNTQYFWNDQSQLREKRRTTPSG